MSPLDMEFVFLVSSDGRVALPRGAMGLCLRFVIVVFPDHTHLLFLGNSPSSLRCLMLSTTFS